MNNVKRSCEVYNLDFDNKVYSHKQEIPLDERLLTEQGHCRICNLFAGWFKEEEDSDGRDADKG